MKGKSFKPGTRTSLTPTFFIKLRVLQHHHCSFETIQNPTQWNGCVRVVRLSEAII